MSNNLVPEESSVMDRILEIWADAARTRSTMPSEPALATTLGVSRAALREAMIRLEERGYLHRSQGTGTSVNEALLAASNRIDEQREQTEVISRAGARPGLRIIRREIVVVGESDQDRYGVAPGTTALMTTKVWTANEVPVTLATDTIPLRVPDLVEKDVATPVFELSAEIGVGAAVWEMVQVNPVALSRLEAWLLSQPAGALALCLDLRGLSPQGVTAYWSRELQLPGTLDLALVRHIKRPPRRGD